MFYQGAVCPDIAINGGCRPLENLRGLHPHFFLLYIEKSIIWNIGQITWQFKLSPRLFTKLYHLFVLFLL